MESSAASTMLWGGRFTGAIDDLMFKFNESLSFDKVLRTADIQGSVAFAKALQRLSLLTDEELGKITEVFKKVEKEWEDGTFPIDPKADEDIHTANERRLAEVIGSSIAGKIHTGRSRNDHATFVMNDLERLKGVQDRVSSCPLGLGALAGTPFGIDHKFLAKELGFKSVYPNSIAAVADRDFVIDTLQLASLLIAHLSRLSEDLIIFSTAEFGFVRVTDAYSTGSSLMPQKKNPDSLEQATGFLAIFKSLPTSYNKDLQESVEPLLDCVKTVSDCLTIAAGVVSSLHVFGDKMQAALTADMLAADTHHIAGAIVRAAEEKGISIAELPPEDLRRISPLFEADVAEVFDFEKSVERRSAAGGTGSISVQSQIASIELLLMKSPIDAMAAKRNRASSCTA